MLEHEPNGPKFFDPDFLDEKLDVGQDDAKLLAKELAKKGILVGMSSGAAMWGALKIAEKIDNGTIVTVFPDRGEKYLSTGLFR